MRALVIDGLVRRGSLRWNVRPPTLWKLTMRHSPHRIVRNRPQYFSGEEPLVTYPRIPGHEVAATLEHVPANDSACPRNECDDVALHELWQVQRLPPGPRQRMPLQPDAGRAARDAR